MSNKIINRFIVASILVSSTFLGACSKQNQLERDLEAYSERLQSFTEIQIDKVDNSYTLSLPKKSILKQEIPDVTINLREFYAFNECSLNQLVALRNTALGKMQLPSARFAYESQLIHEMESCATFLQNEEFENDKNDALVEKLQAWTDIKQAQLPLAWANLITQSDETYQMLNKASGFIQGNSSDDLQGTKQSLAFLLRIKTEQAIDLSVLESHLQQLSQSHLLSKKWRSHLLLTRQLDAITPLLKTYLQQNNCETPQQEKDLAIMRNIFTMFFAEKIQAIGGELNRYHYQLSPIITALLESHAWPEAYTDYVRKHHFEDHQTYKQSMQNHIEAWQALFARCD